MTPDVYVARVIELITTGRDQEALDFADRIEPTVSPPLSIAQIELVGGVLEGAITAVRLVEWEAKARQRRTA